MENEKELQGQETNENLESQVEPTEEVKSEISTSQEEISKDEVSEAVISEPEVVEAEVSEAVNSEPVIAEEKVSEPVLSKSINLDKTPDSTPKEAYADIQNQPSSEEQSEIKTKWNWGAFSFPMWFGIANRAYLGLLILLGLIPWIGWIFAIVWMIVFGFQGEKWALENRDNKYRDEEEFRKVMDGWNRAGFVAFIIGIVLVAIAILLLIFFLVAVFSGYNNIDSGYHDFGNY